MEGVIDRLDRAARAQVAGVVFGGQKPLLMGLALFFCFLGFISEAPRVETIAVLVSAAMAATASVMLYVRSRYALHASALLFLAVGIGSFWFFDNHSHAPIRWLARFLYSAGFLSIAFSLWRNGSQFAMVQGRGWETERTQVRNWLSNLQSWNPSIPVAEVATGSFWKGYFTYKLLNCGNCWAYAKFKTGSDRALEYRVLALASVAVLVANSEQLQLQIGKRLIRSAQPTTKSRETLFAWKQQGLL